MAVKSEEKAQQKEREFREILDGLADVEWYHKAGEKDMDAEANMEQFLSRLNVSDYELKWVSKENLHDVLGELTFTESPLWDALKDMPGQFKETIVANGLDGRPLQKAVDLAPVSVYHPAFAGAYQQFGDKKAVQYLSVGAMYIGLMTSLSVLAEEEKLFEPIVEMIKSGHGPLGPSGKTIYLI